MLLELCGSLAVELLADGIVLGKRALRTNHFVEIVRQPFLVLSQLAEAFHRSLEFADFVRNVGIFDCFSALCRFRPKVLCREHGRLLAMARVKRGRARRCQKACLLGVVTVYGDDRVELRGLLRIRRELAVIGNWPYGFGTHSGNLPDQPNGVKVGVAASGESRRSFGCGARFSGSGTMVPRQLKDA